MPSLMVMTVIVSEESLARDRQTHGQTDRQTVRQTDTHTHIASSMLTFFMEKEEGRSDQLSLKRPGEEEEGLSICIFCIFFLKMICVKRIVL